MAASASKKASNTPAWLKRQKRFHTEFQFPHAAGRARHVMLWTQKECTASRKIRSFRPLAPRRERQARKTSSTVAQSSSVIRVSMVGSSQTDLPSVTDPRTWESTHRILSPIRPHGLGPVRITTGRAGANSWAASQVLEAHPEAVLDLIEMLLAEGRKTRPNEKLVSAYVYMIGQALEFIRIALENGQASAQEQAGCGRN